MDCTIGRLTIANLGQPLEKRELIEYTTAVANRGCSQIYQKAKSEWNDRVVSASDDRFIKIVRDSRPLGKQNPGRPQKRWTGNLESTSIESP